MIHASQIKTRSSIIDKMDDNILKIARKQGVEMVIDILQEISAVYKELLNDKPAKLLVIVDEGCTSEVGFMKKMAENSRQGLRKAEAMVVNTLGKRLEVNFYIRRFKLDYPNCCF
jgi:hypothetical protein